MKWYSVKDLLAGYSLTKDQIRAMCKSGELGAMRFKDGRYHSNHGQYIIPEGELSKLSAYKIGEPLFKEEHQPSEYLTPRNQDDEAKRMAELVGEYEAYLHSSEWQELREQAMKRDGWQCRMCGTGKNLRVHHVNYEHVGTEQELEDLLTLCDDCHQKVHVKDNRTESANAESKND